VRAGADVVRLAPGRPGTVRCSRRPNDPVLRQATSTSGCGRTASRSRDGHPGVGDATWVGHGRPSAPSATSPTSRFWSTGWGAHPLPRRRRAGSAGHRRCHRQLRLRLTSLLHKPHHPLPQLLRTLPKCRYGPHPLGESDPPSISGRFTPAAHQDGVRVPLRTRLHRPGHAQPGRPPPTLPGRN
jgi:hypothetical protein